jgi:hypothetical protein
VVATNALRSWAAHVPVQLEITYTPCCRAIQGWVWVAAVPMVLIGSPRKNRPYVRQLTDAPLPPARRPASWSHTAGRPKALHEFSAIADHAPGLPSEASALRPKAFRRRVAQAGRRAGGKGEGSEGPTAYPTAAAVGYAIVPVGRRADFFQRRLIQETGFLSS